MTASILHPADLDRLGKLLGLLGSEHDGERAAAALKADELLRCRGVTWAEPVGRLKATGEIVSLPASEALRHRDDARECLAAGAIWTERERDFLTNMTRKRRLPTPAQQEWLDSLVDRVRMARAA